MKTQDFSTNNTYLTELLIFDLCCCINSSNSAPSSLTRFCINNSIVLSPPLSIRSLASVPGDVL